MSIAEIIGIIFGSSVLSAVVTAFATRRKQNADTANSISEAWEKLIQPMEIRLKENVEEIAALKCRIGELENAGREKDKTIELQAERIQDLENEVEQLKTQLEALGQKPKNKKAKGD